jgi:hypothetical protein
VYQQWIVQERIQENNSVYNSLKKNYLGIHLTKEWKTSTMKTIKHWRKKSKKITEDGKISHAHRLVE